MCFVAIAVRVLVFVLFGITADLSDLKPILTLDRFENVCLLKIIKNLDTCIYFPRCLGDVHVLMFQIQNQFQARKFKLIFVHFWREKSKIFFVHFWREKSKIFFVHLRAKIQFHFCAKIRKVCFIGLLLFTFFMVTFQMSFQC